MSGDTGLYSICPTFKEKFPPAEVKKIIGTFLAEFLADKSCVWALTIHARPPASHGLRGCHCYSLSLALAVIIRS